jgi:predicted AAA+ superfamily ATPase
MMYIHRAIEKLLKEALGQFPAVLITGPRQAGKSIVLSLQEKKTPLVEGVFAEHWSLAR